MLRILAAAAIQPPPAVSFSFQIGKTGVEHSTAAKKKKRYCRKARMTILSKKPFPLRPSILCRNSSAEGRSAARKKTHPTSTHSRVKTR